MTFKWDYVHTTWRSATIAKDFLKKHDARLNDRWWTTNHRNVTIRVFRLRDAFWFRVVLSAPSLINEGHLPSTSRTVRLWNAICKHSSLSRSIRIGSKDVSSNSTCNASSRHLLNGPWQAQILQIQRCWVLFAQFARTSRSICYSSAARHYIYTVDVKAYGLFITLLDVSYGVFDHILLRW